MKMGTQNLYDFILQRDLAGPGKRDASAWLHEQQELANRSRTQITSSTPLQRSLERAQVASRTISSDTQKEAYIAALVREIQDREENVRRTEISFQSLTDLLMKYNALTINTKVRGAFSDRLRQDFQSQRKMSVAQLWYTIASNRKIRTFWVQEPWGELVFSLNRVCTHCVNCTHLICKMRWDSWVQTWQISLTDLSTLEDVVTHVARRQPASTRAPEMDEKMQQHLITELGALVHEESELVYSEEDHRERNRVYLENIFRENGYCDVLECCKMARGESDRGKRCSEHQWVQGGDEENECETFCSYLE
jgi:hypothetical protein